MSLWDRIVSQEGFAGAFLEEPVFEMDFVPYRRQISMAVWHLSHPPLLPFFCLLLSKYELHPCLWQLFSFPYCLLLLGLQLLYVPGGSDSEIHLLNDPLFLSVVSAQEATRWCLLAKIVVVFKWEHLFAQLSSFSAAACGQQCTNCECPEAEGPIWSRSPNHFS